MLFDIFNIPKEKEYDYWVKRVQFVAATLNFDYFKLWEIPEYEFEILEGIAQKQIDREKERVDELRKKLE